MHPFPEPLDIRRGDAIVTLTVLRVGDIVRPERVNARTVGLRALARDEAAAEAGPLFRIEAGDTAGTMRLVQVRADGPLN
jgi:hypothetical protein